MEPPKEPPILNSESTTSSDHGVETENQNGNQIRDDTRHRPQYNHLHPYSRELIPPRYFACHKIWEVTPHRQLQSHSSASFYNRTVPNFVTCSCEHFWECPHDRVRNTDLFTSKPPYVVNVQNALKNLPKRYADLVINTYRNRLLNFYHLLDVNNLNTEDPMLDVYTLDYQYRDINNIDLNNALRTINYLNIPVNLMGKNDVTLEDIIPDLFNIPIIPDFNMDMNYNLPHNNTTHTTDSKCNSFSYSGKYKSDNNTIGNDTNTIGNSADNMVNDTDTIGNLSNETPQESNDIATSLSENHTDNTNIGHDAPTPPITIPSFSDTFVINTNISNDNPSSPIYIRSSSNSPVAGITTNKNTNDTPNFEPSSSDHSK